MAGRRAAPGRARGGEIVQAPRVAGARVAAGAAAVGCALAVAGYGASRAGSLTAGAAAAGGLLALALAVGVALRRAGVVPWTVFGLAALYAATLRGSAVDGWSVAVGAGLLLAAELAYASIEHESRLRADRVIALRAVAAVCGLVAGGALVGLVVLTVAGLSVGAGLPLAAAGTAAAVGLLVLVARLARG